MSFSNLLKPPSRQTPSIRQILSTELMPTHSFVRLRSRRHRPPSPSHQVDQPCWLPGGQGVAGSNPVSPTFENVFAGRKPAGAFFQFMTNDIRRGWNPLLGPSVRGLHPTFGSVSAVQEHFRWPRWSLPQTPLLGDSAEGRFCWASGALGDISAGQLRVYAVRVSGLEARGSAAPPFTREPPPCADAVST
jgi:hypothetical protein